MSWETRAFFPSFFLFLFLFFLFLFGARGGGNELVRVVKMKESFRPAMQQTRAKNEQKNLRAGY